MSDPHRGAGPLAHLDIPLERDRFMRSLIRDLVSVLEDVVGLEQAHAFVGSVGQRMGKRINELYTKALGVSTLSREQVAQVLVDLKQRIRGDFRLIEEDADRIVLAASAAPSETGWWAMLPCA